MVRTFSDYKVTFVVTGTPSIYTAIIKNSTVLVNTTSTAIISFSEEGDYTCEATSKYGTEIKEFSVIFGENIAIIETKLKYSTKG